MFAQNITLEWYFYEGQEEDEESWLHFVNGKSSILGWDKSIRRTNMDWGRVRMMLGQVLLVAVLVAAVGYQLWNAAEVGLAQIENELSDTINLELWLCEHGDVVESDFLFDAESPVPLDESRLCQFGQSDATGTETVKPNIDIQNVKVRGDKAMVDIAVTVPNESGASTTVYKTLFYRRTVDSWLATAPDVSLWGAQRTIETQFFRFEFRKQDAEAMEILAASMDKLYIEVRRNLGLGIPSNGEILTVAIKMDGRPQSRFGYPNLDESRFLLPSPTLLPADSYNEQAKLLENILLSQLTRRTLDEALTMYEIRPIWTPMIHSLYLYLWLGQDDAVGWLFSAEHERRGRLAQNLGIDMALNYEEPTISNNDGLINAQDQTQYVAAEMLMEYILLRNGLGQVPRLLDGFSTYDSWETLLPAVFGVTSSEFEEEWHVYLNERYSPH